MGKMKEGLPYVGMIFGQVIQAGQIIVSKRAILTGMTNFNFVFYANAFASILILPASLVIHRSRPPLTSSVILIFFLLGSASCLTQLVGYTGLQYTPAVYSSAMINLIPGLTFVLAVIFRMEKADCGSSSTWAKSAGTAVSIIGALVAALYQGPTLLSSASMSSNSFHLYEHETNLILGGSLFILQDVLAAAFIIIQAIAMKKYPAELVVLFFYCFFIAVLSALLSLVFEGRNGSWGLLPSARLVAVLFSAVFGCGVQIGIGMWCVKIKGPLFVAMFHPLGIIISAIMGLIFLGDPIHLGTLLGSIVIVIGFYSFVWGKIKERTVNPKEATGETNQESITGRVPLLQNNV